VRGIASLTFIALMPVASLIAQETGSLSGRISGADSLPLARARVSVVGTDLVAMADANGAFMFRAVPRGSREIDVRLLGYSPQRVPVDIRGGDSVFIRARLVALEPVQMPSVAVVANYNGSLRAFEERRLHGPGTFLTRDEIVRMHPRQVTDVLRRIPGLQVRPVAGFYGENLAVMQRGSRCPVMFYVNGSPVPIADVAINNYVAAEDLMAIEIFSTSELPAQFNSSAGGAKCGMVGLWTRSGNLPDNR